MLFPDQRGSTPHFSELLGPSKDSGGASHEKKSPRPHQKEAVKDLVNALSVSGSDVRTQGHMACGTGKTMVALWVAEKMKAEKTLLAEPSLALIAQNLKEWQANARGPRPEVLVVCSDQTVVRPNQDEIKVDLRDIPARVTNNPEEIAQFLKSKSERKILMSTYHSLPLLGKAMETRGTGRFDIAVADEAHRTAAKEDGAFTFFHYQEAIRSRARLYLTATPKIYEGDSEVKISMDDKSIFGKVGHSLPFSKAIELGLLTDYRLVVATLPENYGAKKGQHSTKEMRDAVGQLAVLRAIEKYHLSKVLSFHSTVARAYEFAESLEVTGPKYLKDRSIWVHGVDGKMPTSTRSNLLKLLAERPKKALSLIANCRCLTEGIDVPAIDGVVFFDPKKEGVDIVQAIGRAIRQSTITNKQFGTIIVPLVVPTHIESSDFLESSEFQKIAQVMRALRAHDDRFEIRMKDTLLDWSSNADSPNGNKASPIQFEIENLPDEMRRGLSTKVLKVGSGIKGQVLTESEILSAARSFFELHKKLPNAFSTEDVPGMPNENWHAINTAGQIGLRGLEKGRTLAVIFKELRKELGLSRELSEEGIRSAARNFYEKHGKLPSILTKISIPEFPNETWRTIDSAGQKGTRGLEPGRTLSKILAPLRKDLGVASDLTEEAILKAGKAYFKLHGKLPTKASTEPVPGMPGISWHVINAAGRDGKRGLEPQRTLSAIIAPLRLEPKFKTKEDFSEQLIIKAARKFYKLHSKLPTADSTEPVPGMPGETWDSVNSSGNRGARGLEKGRTLAVILGPLRKELGYKSELSEEKILAAARIYFKDHKVMPIVNSTEPVPGLPHETWGGINAAGQHGNRGLERGRTLAVILAPLKKELGAVKRTFVEEEIIESARKYYELTGKLPTALSTDPVPGMEGETWKKVQTAGWYGSRGLSAGRTLTKILAPLREELGL